jgi:hypothetical protein
VLRSAGRSGKLADPVNRPIRHVLIAVAACSAFIAAVPVTANAGCGGVQWKPAAKRPKHGRPPLAIGDSTMLLAMENLSRAGYNVNAHGCRGWEEGLGVIRRRAADGKLPHMVVMALGADFTISRHDIWRALHIIGPDRVLGLVTPRELGGGSGSDAVHCREAAAHYKKRIVLLDWVKYSRGQRGWFQPDGLHLTYAGARAFARLFKKALPYAQPQPPASS